MSEQKMREALERALESLSQLHGIDTETECVTIDVMDEISLIREALAQQPAAGAELTDAEIVTASGFKGLTKTEIGICRRVIAAHEAKKAGGGV